MPEGNEIQTIPAGRDLVVVQRNPTSGSGRGRREVVRLLAELKNLGFQVRVYTDRVRLSRFVNRPADSKNPSAADRLRCIVAAGGDGTISSLVQRHPEIPIAVLPLGTENLVAKHLGLHCNGADLASVISYGRFQNFDTGLVGDHRFLLMASAGLDAEVVRLLALARTGNISHFSYLKPILAAFLSYRFPNLQVSNELGEVVATGSHVLVSNMPEYGMKIPFTPTANPHDGLLDVRVFKKSGIIRSATHLLRTRLGLKDSIVQVARFKAPLVSLKSEDTSVPLQADGDPCGSGSVTFRVAEERMRLLVRSDFKKP